MAEQTYTHLVLLLNEDMSIKGNENNESIYISKERVVSPADVSETNFTVDILQATLAEVGGENLRLDVYLNDDLTVGNYKVSSEEFDINDNNYTLVEFDGTKMYKNITLSSLPPVPPSTPEGGMKLNKKPKKKTKKGTYKRQSNKTK